MQMRFLIPIVVMTLSATNVLASGSYKGKGRRPPDRLEATQYNLGKKLFTGKAELPEPSAELLERANRAAHDPAVAPARQGARPHRRDVTRRPVER